MGCCHAKIPIKPVERNLNFLTEKYPIPRDFIKTTSIQENYESKGTLGYGTSGSVRKSTQKHLKVPFAVKSFAKESSMGSKPELIYREISILRQLDHPNIIHLHEVYEDSKNIHCVTDYCDGGELFDRLSQKKRFTEAEASKVLFQLLYAINHIHSKDLMHLDLKPENILYIKKTADSEIKVIDFGLAMHIADTAGEAIGTPTYMAPEAIDGEYSQKADIWSLGVILYTLVVGYQPFDGTNKAKIFNQIRKAQVKFKVKDLSEDCRDLIKKMICKDTKSRLSAFEAMGHPWFSKITTGNVKKLPLHKQENPLKLECVKAFIKNRDVSFAVFLQYDKDKNGLAEVDGELITYTQFVVRRFNQTISEEELRGICKFLFNQEDRIEKEVLVSVLEASGNNITGDFVEALPNSLSVSDISRNYMN